MANTSVSKRNYPWTTTLGDRRVTLRLMQAEDRDALLAFARLLPTDDLLFLSIDITEPEAVDGWMREIKAGRVVTVLAESDGRLVGHGTLTVNNLTWTRHLGEIQLLISPEFRGKGLGNLLADEVNTIARAKELQKVVARMASEQKGARQVFERLGFTVEALLADYVIDRRGRTHDLIVMSYDVTGLTL
ncbi:MAG TPA: GNAT family protein [Pyrinomonadaceae bacterium]|jgi:RimJ/RimL family protein N-acetyltransferase